MPLRLPALASAILLSFSAAALAADDASPSGMPAEPAPSVTPVPEPEIPFQVIAFAGLLLIWRNRRRTVLG